MGISATIAAIASAGATIYSANKQAGAQKKASAEATRQNEMAMANAQRETKRAEMRTPNTAALLAMAGNTQGTNASTISAGAQGILPSTLTLGGNPLGGKRTTLGA